MTKQQQRKINKVNAALDLMNNGKTIKEVYTAVGYSRVDKLKRALTELGYIEVEGKWQNCNTDCNTKYNSMEKLIEVKRPTNINTKHLQLLKNLEQEEDTLLNMIEWYKTYSSTSITCNTHIKIELPKSENVMISTRSNKVVWEQFKVFAKNNNANFTMGDLVAQALLNYMDSINNTTRCKSSKEQA